MSNTNTKDGLVRFIMSAVKMYPESKPNQLNPVVYHSSFMMSIDEIKKAIPGKHKEKFEKEMASALFNYRKHFKPRNEYANEAIGHYLSSRIQIVLSKVWFSMSKNSKEKYLSKLKKDVLNEIRKGYFDPYLTNAPNSKTMNNFHKNRYKLMEKLIMEKQVMPLTKEAKGRENAKIQRKIKNTRKNLMANLEASSTASRVKQKEMERIQTLLMSLKRLNPNGQMGNAMSTVEEQLKASAKNPENYKRINNTRTKLFREIREGVNTKNHRNLNYSMPFKPWGRPIEGYRNNTGAYYPRNKSAVPAEKEEKWRYKL